MGLRWATNKNLGSEGLTSEVMVVHLGQTSKYIGMLITPAIAFKNQLAPQTKVCSKQLRTGGWNGSANIGSCGAAGGGKRWMSPIASDL